MIPGICHISSLWRKKIMPNSKDVPASNETIDNQNINYSQTAGIKPIDSGILPEAVEKRSYLSYVEECADLLMKYGTDRYGKKHSLLLVTILDVRTRTCPEFPPKSAATPYMRPAFYKHSPPSKPAPFPTPYRNWHPSEADLSWGNHQAYDWKPVENTQDYGLQKGGFNKTEFKAVKAIGLCIEVEFQPGLGGGVYDLLINGQKLLDAKKAGTYRFPDSEVQNSTYEKQILPDREEFLSKFSLPDSADDDEYFPVFMWEQRETDPSEKEEAKSLCEWLMYEFDRPMEISDIQVFWMDNGESYRVPVSWKVMYAKSMDKSKVKYPPYPVVPWRGEKRQLYWKPRSSDFFEDQATYRALHNLSKITGDSKYADFVDESLRYAMGITDSKDMFWWGGHRCFDVFADEKMLPNEDYEEPHETAINCPEWDILWQTDKEATRKEIEGVWEWHVNDKETGEHDRHNFGRKGVPFSMNGGQFVFDLCFLYSKTGDKVYLERAELIEEFHWNLSNKKTGLAPEVAFTEEYLKDFRDRNAPPTEWILSSHQVVGLLCYYLLKSYEITGVEKFRDHALTHLKAYARYAYDSEAGKFYGALNIEDGKPVTEPRIQGSPNIPYGHVDIWQPYQYGSEYAFNAAQVYAYAYTLTGDEDMLDTAKKWADFIRNNPPETGCLEDTWYELYARLFSRYGTFAGYYGRAISFYINMYANTGDNIYLDDARKLAREAISKLYYKGIFRGHPARPYYAAVDNVGNLLFALVQLDRVMELGDSVVGKKAIPIRNGGRDTIGFDNW